MQPLIEAGALRIRGVQARNVLEVIQALRSQGLFNLRPAVSSHRALQVPHQPFAVHAALLGAYICASRHSVQVLVPEVAEIAQLVALSPDCCERLLNLRGQLRGGHQVIHLGQLVFIQLRRAFLVPECRVLRLPDLRVQFPELVPCHLVQRVIS